MSSQAPSSDIPLLLVVLLRVVGLIIASGLALLLVVIVLIPSPPATVMDLAGTRWSVVSVDGHAVAPPPSLELHDDANTATLSLACAEVTLGWVEDTDGAAIGFGTEVIPDPCRALDQSATDRRVLDAIQGIDCWSIQDNDHTTLSCGRDIELVRTSSSRGLRLAVGPTGWYGGWYRPIHKAPRKTSKGPFRA